MSKREMDCMVPRRPFGKAFSLKPYQKIIAQGLPISRKNPWAPWAPGGFPIGPLWASGGAASEVLYSRWVNRRMGGSSVWSLSGD